MALRQTVLRWLLLVKLCKSKSSSTGNYTCSNSSSSRRNSSKKRKKDRTQGPSAADSTLNPSVPVVLHAQLWIRLRVCASGLTLESLRVKLQGL